MVVVIVADKKEPAEGDDTEVEECAETGRQTEGCNQFTKPRDSIKELFALQCTWIWNAQNTLARIVTNHRKYAHVTPILKQLHWLPVKYRCIFKTATLVYKFVNIGAPSYFEPFLSLSSCPYSTRHSHLDHQYLTVPPFHSSVFKSVKHFDHSFAFDAPKIWNELHHDVRSATSVASFRNKLKTYLFAKAYLPQPPPSPLCPLGMTCLCPSINVNCLALCSNAP